MISQDVYERISKIDYSALSEEERIRVTWLIKEYNQAKKDLPIRDFKPLKHQKDICEAIWDFNWLDPVYKYILFIWGNGSWKTIGSVYIDILLALGQNWLKYWLPFIWSKRQILVITKTSDLIKTNLEPYFIWTDSLEDSIKIPPKEIFKIKRDPSTSALKEIQLINWNKILFRTYDAWQSRLEGSSPDFVHLDELPDREDIFIELLRWTRKRSAQMLLSFTPTKFNPAVFNYFYSQESDEVRKKTYIKEVDSLENTFADHTWLLWLTEDERQIRRFWKFVPPTWLVYSYFRREKNILNISSLSDIKPCKIYWALDFWVKHPLAFLFIAVDEYDNIIVFDMIYQEKLLLKDLVNLISERKNKWWFEFEYIVADSADARARLELKELWLNTIPADKFSKWETNLSNRRAWIFKINWLFDSSKLFISDNCSSLIREIETHAYKWNWGEDVIKENDDALDALRYFIFWYTKKDIIKNYKNKIRPKNITKNNY